MSEAHHQDAPGSGIDRFSLVSGGPFHTLLGRLGLLAADGLPRLSSALGLALLAWLLPTVLAVGQWLVDPEYRGLTVLTDATVYARYLIAIWVMVATERYADSRIGSLTGHFKKAGLLADEARAGFDRALITADRQSAAAIPEVISLALALAISVFATIFASEVAATSWEGVRIGDADRLSWAGLSVALFSNVLFLFLVFRWTWRFMVWTGLLWRVAHLPLRLVPMHPDRSGGLGFLALFPAIFSGVVVAASTFVSASFIKALHFMESDPVTAWYAVALWTVLVLVIFLGPLAFFTRPLYRLRMQALLDYRRLAQQHHQSFHQQWIDDGDHGPDLLGSTDPSSAADLNAAVQSALDMRVFPVDRLSYQELLVSTLAPFLALLLYQVPIAQLVDFLVNAAV